MLPRSRSLRRLVAPLGLAVVAGVLVLAPAPQAQAAASSALSDGELKVETSSRLDPSPDSGDPNPATCTATEPHGIETERVLADGTQSLATQDQGTYADSVDTADTVTSSGSASGTATSTFAGDIRRVSVTGTVSATNDAVQGADSDCDVEVNSQVQLQFDIDVLRPGFIEFRGTGSRYGQLSISMYGDPVSYFDDINGTSGTTTTRIWAPAGHYWIVIQLDVDRDRDDVDAPLPTTLTSRMGASFAFIPAGTATGATSGAGAGAVSYPATLSCTARSARLTWRAPAKGKPVVVRVNGRKVRSLKKANPGGSIIVGKLSPTSRVTIATTVGKRTAVRTYEACRAPGF